MKYSESVTMGAGCFLCGAWPCVCGKFKRYPGPSFAFERRAEAHGSGNRGVLACLLVLALALASLPAPCLAETEAAGPALAPGQPMRGPEDALGVWWPAATAQALATEHLRLTATTELSRLQAQKITLLEERLQLREEIDKSLTLQVTTLVETLDGCSDREAVQALRALRAEEKLTNARWIWAAIGAGVVVVLVGGAWALTSSL